MKKFILITLIIFVHFVNFTNLIVYAAPINSPEFKKIYEQLYKIHNSFLTGNYIDVLIKGPKFIKEIQEIRDANPNNEEINMNLMFYQFQMNEILEAKL